MCCAPAADWTPAAISRASCVLLMQAQRRFRERQKALISNLKDKAATLDKRVDEQVGTAAGSLRLL